MTDLSMQSAAHDAALQAAPVRQGMKLALQWRLLVLCTVLLLVPMLLATYPFWTNLSEAFDHSVRAAELAQRLDGVAVSDLELMFKKQMGFVNAGLMLAAIVTLLLSPLIAGIAATVARAPEKLGMRAMLAGGGAQYRRMGYMLLWSLVPLGLVFAINGGFAAAIGKQEEKAILETDLDGLRMTAHIVFLALFVFVHATVDAGRAVLALDRRRVSPFKAWWDGVRLVLRRPLATLGGYVVVTVLGLAVAGALAFARLQASSGSGGGVLLGFVLTELGVAALVWMRCARLFALAGQARA
ncbi:MAG: hypothetical protein ACXU8N_00800 [Telluria sp.]